MREILFFVSDLDDSRVSRVGRATGSHLQDLKILEEAKNERRNRLQGIAI